MAVGGMRETGVRGGLFLLPPFLSKNPLTLWSYSGPKRAGKQNLFPTHLPEQRLLPSHCAFLLLLSSTCQGLVSKAALSLVIRRCAPETPEADVRYACLMIDHALPKHTALSHEVG